MTPAGGADGVIMQWDVSDGSIQDGRFSGPSINLKHPYTGDGRPIDIKSLDYNDNTGMILLGTCDSDIWEVTDNTQVTESGVRTIHVQHIQFLVCTVWDLC